MLQGFVITADHEEKRASHVQHLLRQLPGLKKARAIYPSREKIPFLQKIKEKTLGRYDTEFLDGEIGILLSNRRIWMQIASHQGSEKDHFLILESDSQINNHEVLIRHFDAVTRSYDLFFWGAWHGYMRLLRSSEQDIGHGYKVGSPLMRSVSCAHGYSINRKAARYLLQKTGKLRYPVDEFKRYVQKGALRIGGVTPELISQAPGQSTIDPLNKKYRTRYWWIRLLDIRNRIISYFS